MIEPKKFLKDFDGVIFYQEAIPEYYLPKLSPSASIEINMNSTLVAAQRVLYQRVVDSIANNQITLILGKAGTGKSYFIKALSNRLQNKMVVVAPTGIAAQNIGGQTIHSLFGLPLTVWNKSLINTSDDIGNICRQIKLLVIDEISMVRADILDAVDLTMQYHRDSCEPFGGARTLIVGDLHQLPPVLTNDDKGKYRQYYQNPYFFDSHVIKTAMQNNQIKLVEFNIPFRQQEGDIFLKALDKISQCNLDEETDNLFRSRILNQRSSYRTSSFPTILSPYRKAVERYNLERLYRIESPSYFYQALITGSYFRKKEDDLPNYINLEFRMGARVIFVKNDPGGNWVNGTVGTIVGLHPDHVEVEIHGKVKSVTKATWSENRYIVRKGVLEKIEIGKFEQLPIKLGWALTIHKSQGLTLENIYLDLGWQAFAYGQVYVALSRVRNLEDILLRRAIQKRDLKDAHGIEEFMRKLTS